MNRALVRHTLICFLALVAVTGVMMAVVMRYPKPPKRIPDVPFTREQEQMLRPWFTITQPIFLRRAESGAVLPSLPLAFEHPFLILQAPRSAGLMDFIDRHVRPDTKQPAEALLRQTLTELFGEDLSPAHDLLPLLQGDVMVQIADAPAAGVHEPQLRFFVAGTSDDPTGLDHRLARLHALFAQHLPLTREEQRTFDQGWTFETLRADPEALEQSGRAVDRWRIRSTIHRESGRALLTAQDHRKFIVTNDPAAFDASMQRAHGTVSIPFRAVSFVTGGLIDMDGLHPILELLAPEGTTLPAMGGRYKWSIGQENGRMIVVLDQETRTENPEVK